MMHVQYQNIPYRVMEKPTNLHVLYWVTLLCRYRNFYCALCHGVTDILHWTMEIGCIEVANDECRFPVDSTRPQRPSRPFSNQVDGFAAMYLDNPAAENLLRWVRNSVAQQHQAFPTMIACMTYVVL